MAEPICKRPIIGREVPVISSDQGPARKRARVEPENIPSRRKGGKKGISASKARKAAPSRVRKTYRDRQKMQPSSPGRFVDRDVDYDEIPPSTAVPNLSTAKGCTLPQTLTSDDTRASTATPMKGTNRRTALPSLPTMGSGPVDVVPNDKKREMVGKPDHADGHRRSIQVPDIQVGHVDDDPIQSFSSSPSEPLLLTADVVRFSTHHLPRILYLPLFSLNPKYPESQPLAKVYVRPNLTLLQRPLTWHLSLQLSR